MMKKEVLLILLLSSLVFLAGCQQADNAKNKFIGLFSSSRDNSSNITCSCPVCEWDSAAGLDGALYVFENHKVQLQTFLQQAGSYIDCALPAVQDPDIANELIDAYNHAVDVMLLLDQSATMDCIGGCIPKKDTFYNQIYSSGLKVKVKPDMHSIFCVSEDGVFLSSSSFDGQQRLDNSLFLKSEGLNLAYTRYFESIWKE